ncbi:uncharacterized protein LOC111138291 isoform X2 [Crassostrea virginica]
MVSLSSLLQSPVQAILRPAMWLPYIKNLHSYKEVWTYKKEKDEILKAILDNLELLKTEDKKGTVYDIHKINEDASFVRIFAFTWAEWLDVMEFTVNKESVEAFFWVPFLDNGLNKVRISSMRNLLNSYITEYKVT